MMIDTVDTVLQSRVDDSHTHAHTSVSHYYFTSGGAEKELMVHVVHDVVEYSTVEYSTDCTNQWWSIDVIDIGIMS